MEKCFDFCGVSSYKLNKCVQKLNKCKKQHLTRPNNYCNVFYFLNFTLPQHQQFYWFCVCFAFNGNFLCLQKKFIFAKHCFLGIKAATSFLKGQISSSGKVPMRKKNKTSRCRLVCPFVDLFRFNLCPIIDCSWAALWTEGKAMVIWVIINWCHAEGLKYSLSCRLTNCLANCLCVHCRWMQTCCSLPLAQYLLPLGSFTFWLHFSLSSFYF